MMTTKFLLTLTLVALAGFTLVACETMYGAGRDIEHAGDSVQDAAKQ